MKKFAGLNELFTLFHETSSGFPVSCQKGCAFCCTDRVSITTLEGRLITEFLVTNQAAAKALESAHSRWRPAYTINGLVLDTLCRRSSPAEDDSMPVTPCPLLRDNLCLIYPVRPLVCRVMFSRVACGESTDGAVISPLEMSFNQVFLQALEHLDSNGRSGSLPEVMAFLSGKSDGENLLNNRSMPGFLIPPEHQAPLRPVVESLKKILKVEDGSCDPR